MKTEDKLIEKASTKAVLAVLQQQQKLARHVTIHICIDYEESGQKRIAQHFAIIGKLMFVNLPYSRCRTHPCKYHQRVK